ncbi:MAG: PAS domain S-box protein [Anaerolineales bacterium]|nr:PAS domain S-box protein [Anaerolineales bacterium]
MHYQFTLNMLPLAITAAISGVLALYTWQNRKTAGAAPLSVLMFILFEWGVSYIFELAGTDLQTKIPWEGARFAGVVATPVAWLVFAFEYTGRKAWLNWRRLAMLSAIPVITIVILITNESHGLFRISRELVTQGGFLSIKATDGPWFWSVHAPYTYTLIMIGLVLIIRALLRWPAQYRGQMILILLATLAPIIANLITIFQIIPIQIDLTPFAFTVTGVGMAYALFRHRLLDIAPIARDTIIENMKDGMVILNVHGRIVDINQAARTMIGLSEEKRPIGKQFGDVLSQWPKLIEKYRDVQEADDEISIDIGENLRWYELHLSTLFDENKLRIGRVITVRDITDRKLAELLLQESEARFRQIVENASDIIYRADANGYFTYANPSALHAMGFKDEDELVGKHYLDMVAPEVRHRLKRIYELQFVKRTPITYHEFPSIGPDGREIWLGQNVQLIYEGDKITGFQALARDITAIKKTQDALQIARDQALEASRAKTQLLSKVSHELRTPLGGILGYAELLQGNTFGDLSERQHKAISEIVDSGEYLTNMVNELLDEAQLRSSTATLLEKMFSPFKLIQSAVSGMDILAQKKGLLFSVQIDPALPQLIYGDDRRIRQIIINLIGNSIKFTKEGSVRLNVRRPDENHWEIQVTDTGIGIPQSEQATIFEPFRQLNSAVTRDNRGVGLGLSITKQLVELMHGRIAVESEHGKGSSFTILLPIMQKE